MTEAYDGRRVVGIDLHLRRSVIVRMIDDGCKLDTVRITNSPAALRRETPGPGSVRGWWSRRRTAGTGARTCSRRPGRGPPGAPAGRQDPQLPPGQERSARYRGPGRPAADGRRGRVELKLPQPYGARSPRCGGWPGSSAPRSPCWSRCSATCWPGMRGTPRSGIGPVLPTPTRPDFCTTWQDVTRSPAHLLGSCR